MDEAPAPAPAENPVISVRGEAMLVVDPEIADIFISFFAQARDRREAFERLVKRNDEVLTLVRSYGDAVEHFASGGLSVVPELRKGRDEKIRSYRGSAQVNVTVADFSVLGELIARLSELETVTLNGPFWRLRQKSPVYRDARTRAVSEALARARDYAAALGCRVVGLIELADIGMSAPPPRAARPLMAAMSAPLAGAAPAAEPPMLDLEPQQQTVHANVEARFHATQPDLATPAKPDAE
jgi:uncharacterized protein